jgi:excisionase family DNA binding protein
MEELITVTEAAEEAGVAASTIYRWIQSGLLSSRLFPDGRQAIALAELEEIREGSVNPKLHQLFTTIASALGEIVELLPAVEHQFGPGWGVLVWTAAQWEPVRQRAVTQADAHRDLRSMPRRGRPPLKELRSRFGRVGSRYPRV